ncbi:MAG: legume lectin beta domain protein [Chitinophagaceae bacterium]|nr:legume lectin beta domain protein [Chitinophagaceae bacterium]
MVTFIRFAVLSLLLILTWFFAEVKAQCGGGPVAGSLTPTSSWQTICVQGGVGYSFNATQASTYVFSFCQGGGSAPSWDTQLMILDNSGTYIGPYNNDFCGTSSQITFVAPATATYRVLITKYNCASDPTCQTLAYQVSIPTNDNICGATYIYGNSCILNYTTYTTNQATNSPQANPGCAGYNGRDVWFATKVPASGKLLMTTNSGAITDGAMAVYKGSSCAGALTQIGCDDDSGPGTMPELNLTGLTPGDSLFIRFWSYNNTEVGTFSIALKDQAPYYCMSGESSEINNGGNCIQLTPNKQSQIGCVWNTTQINMSTAFDYTYTVNLGNSDGGADGMTFTLQNNAAGLSACGNPGSMLAIGPLTNTFIVEFDTFNNGPGAGDIAADHVAIDVNGNLASPVVPAIQASASSTNIEDGLDHTVRITWNPGTQVFNVYFDGSLRMSYTNDIITNVFGGNPLVYWGFTSSTGTFTNQQSLCPGTLPGAPLPVTWGWFDAYMMNQKVNLFWGTYSEENSKEFIVERSADGKNFSPVGTLTAKGNSKSTSQYEFIDEYPLQKYSYYRLKQTDINGAYTYSVMKVVNNGANSSGDIFHLYPNPASSKLDINIELSEDATVSVYDNANVMVHQQSFQEGKGTLNVSQENIAPGIYYVMVQSSSGVYYTKLIFFN